MYVLALSSALSPAGQPVHIENDPRQRVGDLAWAPDSRSLVYSSGGHQAPFRLRRVSLATDASAGPPELLPVGERAIAISIGHMGRLVYSAELRDTNLWKLDLGRPGRVPEDAGPPRSTLDEHMPAYSSGGKRVAFASTRSGSEELWIANVDGTGLRQVTLWAGRSARIRSGHQMILFNSAREGSTDLYLLFPDNLEVRRLTTDPAEELEPKWSRDGRWIYFGSNRTGVRNLEDGGRRWSCHAGHARWGSGRSGVHRSSVPLLRQA
jgi:Tol biopolymer transport system component